MKEYLKKFSTYESADFLSDEDFIDWVKYPDDFNTILWDEVLAAYPDKSGSMDAARELIIAISIQITNTGAAAKAGIWKNIVAEADVRYRSPQVRRLYRLTAVAASLLLATFAVWAGYYAYLHTNEVIATNFGNKTTIRLPDESVITLNRNSKLTYSRLWSAARSREVSLTGEADFRIKHVAVPGFTAAADSFRVNISGLRATVLGTEFNIRSRRGKTALSLRKGKIRIDFLKESHMPVFLAPGEEFIYDPVHTIAVKKKADTAARSAWTKESLILEGTTVADVITILEDDYGFKVQLADKAILNRKLRGTVPMNKIEDLFFVLSHVLNVNILKDDHTLIITDKK